MPPSGQQIEEITMSKDIKSLAEKLAAIHLSNFIESLAKAANNFVDVMNPAESDEVLKYIQSVLCAVDNVVLVATMQHENEEVRSILAASTEVKIKQLIEKHNKEEVKH